MKKSTIYFFYQSNNKGNNFQAMENFQLYLPEIPFL